MSREKLFYKRGPYMVSARSFETPRKLYRISAITHVHLGRSHFYFLLPILLGFFGLIFFYAELLYAHEILFGVTGSIVVGAIAWSIVTLNLRGLNVDGIAAFGLPQQMNAVKKALYRAMKASERQAFRHQETN